MSGLAEGGCLCGKIRFRFERESAISAHHCHCSDCQKSSGTGKATIVFVPDSEVDTQGELKWYTVTGTAGNNVSRGFCGNCGSQLMSLIEESPTLRIIKAGSLDDSSWLKVTSSFWAQTATQWSPVDQSCPSVPQNPNMG